MRRLTGIEMRVVELLIADAEDGIRNIGRVIGDDDPALESIKAARGWLCGVRDNGILVHDADAATGCDR